MRTNLKWAHCVLAMDKGWVSEAIKNRCRRISSSGEKGLVMMSMVNKKCRNMGEDELTCQVLELTVLVQSDSHCVIQSLV